MHRNAPFIAAVALAAAASPALAHHSGAMFDRSKEVTLVGALKEIHWTNPHGWIDLVVQDPSGKVVEWGIEANTPAGLARMGLKKNPPYPAPGDKVTIIVHPVRDGRPVGSFVLMTLADGKTFDYANPFAPATPPPAQAAGR